MFVLNFVERHSWKFYYYFSIFLKLKGVLFSISFNANKGKNMSGPLSQNLSLWLKIATEIIYTENNINRGVSKAIRNHGVIFFFLQIDLNKHDGFIY